MTTIRNYETYGVGPLQIPDPGRKALHAYVSDDSHDTWHGFGAEHGVSVSAILQALTETGTFIELDDPEAGIVLGRTVADHLAIVVSRARRIDAARRRRAR